MLGSESPFKSYAPTEEAAKETLKVKKTEKITKPVKPSNKPTAPSSAVITTTSASCVATPTLDEKFEKAIKFIEDYSIPWFLKSSQVYVATKKAVTGIKTDEKTEKFITQFTEYLKSSTMTLLKAVKPMLTEDDVKNLIVQIDELLMQYLTLFDSFVDASKVNIAHLLRLFKNAVVEHAKKFKIVMDSQIENGKILSSQAVTLFNSSVDKSSDYVRTNYPVVADKTKLALELFEKTKSYLLKEFEAYFKLLKQLLEQSTSAAKVTYQKSIDSSVVVTQSVLQTAQPYVHQAVTLTQPYIAQAVEVCTHEPVKAYLEPIRVRAISVKEALEKSPVSGPYVEIGIKAFENVKTYCLEETPKPVASVGTSTCMAVVATTATH